MIALYIDETENYIYEFYENPRNFITESILDFLDEYNFYKSFSAGVNFMETSARFIEAKRIYEYYSDYYSRPMANNEGFS